MGFYCETVIAINQSAIADAPSHVVECLEYCDTITHKQGKTFYHFNSLKLYRCDELLKWLDTLIDEDGAYQYFCMRILTDESVYVEEFGDYEFANVSVGLKY